MVTRIEWNKVKPATLRAELLEFVVALGLMSVGWLGVPALLLAVFAELLVAVVLSSHLYPERGIRRHLLDVFKLALLLAFTSVFILAAYGAAGGFAGGVTLSLRELAGMVLLIAARGGLMLLDARAAPDPRLHWARSTLLRGASLAVGSFFAAFTCFIPGVLLAGALAELWPTRAADIAIAAMYLLPLGVVACIASTMSEKELARIAGKPYLDG